jgi:hypothetical protein
MLLRITLTYHILNSLTALENKTPGGKFKCLENYPKIYVNMIGKDRMVYSILGSCIEHPSLMLKLYH